MRIRVRRKQKGGSPLAIAAGRLPFAFSLMGSLARLLGLSRYFRSILLQTGSYTAVGRIQRLPVAASAKKKSRETKLCPGQRPESRLFVRRHPCGDQLAEGCIMAARRVLLIASGADKADAVYNAFCGPITPFCPASILQLHNDMVLVGDKAALSKLVAAGVPAYE